MQKYKRDVETVFYPVQCVLGVPFFSKGHPFGLGWSLGGQKAQNSEESGPFVLVLVSLEG